MENLFNWMNNLWLKVENILAIGDIARFVQFLLLFTMFSKGLLLQRRQKGSIWGKGLNHQDLSSTLCVWQSDWSFKCRIFIYFSDNIVDVTFEELLIFISGADRIPPCGFHAPFFIEFYTNEGTEQRLPFASTCALTLSLPRGVANPDNLKRHLMMSLKDSYGFGKMWILS